MQEYPRARAGDDEDDEDAATTAVQSAGSFTASEWRVIEEACAICRPMVAGITLLEATCSVTSSLVLVTLDKIMLAPEFNKHEPGSSDRKKNSSVQRIVKIRVRS